MAKSVTAAERLKKWLEVNRSRFSTNASFALAIDCSEGRLSQILGGAIPSPRLAVRIETATGDAIRSQLWFANLSEGSTA